MSWFKHVEHDDVTVDEPPEQAREQAGRPPDEQPGERNGEQLGGTVKEQHPVGFWAAWVIGGALIVALLLAIVAIGMFAWDGPHRLSVSGTLLLYGSASAAVGALLGFLFGVPRVATGGGSTLSTVTPQNHTQPNTNLEQVSDWLTKVLLGATLTQVGKIPDAGGELFTTMGEALSVNNMAAARAFSGALVVVTGAVGFLFGWLCTRILLASLIEWIEAEVEARFKAAKKARRRARGATVTRPGQLPPRGL